MKCIIYAPESSTSWIRKFFPDYSPYLLRFGNKAYLEFLIDFCIISGIKQIRLISDNPSSEVYDLLGNGMQLGIELSYSAIQPNSPLKKVIQKNRAFCGEDDLLLLSGFIWLDYDKHKSRPLETSDMELSGKAFTALDAWFLINHQQIDSFPDSPSTAVGNSDKLTSFPLDSIQAFYQQSMRIVYEQNANYNLPGYGDSSTFVIGRNVEIPRSAEVKTPIILGNSVQLGKGAQVGPGAIIGDNCLIDNDASLRNSIVMGNSYVGCNLELEDKIIYRNYIIDPYKGIRLDIVDEFLLTQLVKEGYWRCPITQRIVAFILLLVYAIPFALLRPLIRTRASKVECYMNRQQKRKLKLHLYVCPPKNFAGRYFLKLSLDRYHLLPRVLLGQLRLVGSYILEVSEKNANSLKQFPDYAPGIFSYSEFLEHDKDPFQREIDELYYMYHASFWKNFKILKGILCRNLMKRT